MNKLLWNYYKQSNDGQKQLPCLTRNQNTSMA